MYMHLIMMMIISFLDLFTKIENISGDHIILGGDLNKVLNNYADKKGRSLPSNQKHWYHKYFS